MNTIERKYEANETHNSFMNVNQVPTDLPINE